MNNTVGHSARTKCKHLLLEMLLEKELVSIARSYLKTRILPQYILMDLCAGSGDRSSYSGQSSPIIMSKYHSMFRDVFHAEASLILVERDTKTFIELKNNVRREGMSAILLNTDAREIARVPVLTNKDSAMFIHADPNHLQDWPLSNDLLLSSPSRTTILATLGCNISGMKRMSPEARSKWFWWIDMVLQWIPKDYDASLITLRRDRGQWAYLIVCPTNWHNGDRDAEWIHDAFEPWKHGIDVYYHRFNPVGFSQAVSKLFLTKRELEVNNITKEGSPCP